jgi:hypothetical protein
VPPATPELPPPPAELSLEENLVAADDLVALATAFQRDRRELDRRAGIRDSLAAPPPNAAERVTTLAFAPGATRLTAREHARLGRALAIVGRDGSWIVRTGGALAQGRAAAALDALAAAGIEPARVATARLDRDVDLAEIAVRR